MAYLTHSTHRPVQGISLWQRLSALRSTLSERAARERLYRSTIRELDGLSDRDLADLGIARGNVRSVAHEAAHQA